MHIYIERDISIIVVFFFEKCSVQVGQLKNGGHLDMVFGEDDRSRFGNVHLLFHFDDAVAENRKIAHFSLLLPESNHKPYLVLPENVLWLSFCIA